MRKSYFLSGCCLLLVSICLSCSDTYHSGDDTKVSISESEDSYNMSAYFNRNKTRAVHEYMDEQLGKDNNISFVNTEIDATITLDDRTTFYLKTTAGELEIKFNRVDNSKESYMRVKEMCEGLKTVIAKD